MEDKGISLDEQNKLDPYGGKDKIGTYVKDKVEKKELTKDNIESLKRKDEQGTKQAIYNAYATGKVCDGE